MTVGNAASRATERLAAAGISDARLDAERLLCHVAGWDLAALIVHAREPLAEADRSRFERLVDQRAERRPLQHLVGFAHFWRHEFRVTPDVLIPRPETEHLVEAALEWLKAVERPVVVDVGTGSGCIALSIAAERPQALVHAIDLSEAALAIARENAARLALDARVRFHEGDLLEPLHGVSVDLIVSNPPYVGADEIPSLAPEVRDHEPRMALLPPGDRYSVYRRLASQAPAILKPDGMLMVEVGRGMDGEVTRIFEAAGFAVSRIILDLQSIPRVVLASRSRRDT